jgi:hypothetical protein
MKQSDIKLVTYRYCNTMHGTVNLKVAGEYFVRYQHQASRHLLTTNTSNRFLLCQDTCLGAVVGQKLKCQR